MFQAVYCKIHIMLKAKMSFFFNQADHGFTQNPLVDTPARPGGYAAELPLCVLGTWTSTASCGGTIIGWRNHPSKQLHEGICAIGVNLNCKQHSTGMKLKILPLKDMPSQTNIYQDTIPITSPHSPVLSSAQFQRIYKDKTWRDESCGNLSHQLCVCVSLKIQQ